jgi:uncharacterized membrane protein YccF (DUF307 family)
MQDRLSGTRIDSWGGPRHAHPAQWDLAASLRGLLAIGYALAGIICCILIVTIPYGLASFRIADFALWPFGPQLVKRTDAGVPSTIGNIIWIIFAGW